MKKNKYIIIIMIIMLALVSVLYWMASMKKHNEKKVGKTIFDVGTSIAEITIDNKTVTLTGKEREKFIKILKGISEEIDIDSDADINFDILMDFKNGHKGKISTSNRIVIYDYEYFGDNDYFGDVIDDKELSDLLEIIDRNMK